MKEGTKSSKCSLHKLSTNPPIFSIFRILQGESAFFLFPCRNYFSFVCSAKAIITLPMACFLTKMCWHFSSTVVFLPIFLVSLCHFYSFLLLFILITLIGFGRGSRDKHMFSLPCLTGSLWGFAFRPAFNATGFAQGNSYFKRVEKFVFLILTLLQTLNTVP